MRAKCTKIVENSSINIFKTEPEAKLRKKNACWVNGHWSLVYYCRPQQLHVYFAFSHCYLVEQNIHMPEKFTYMKVTTLNKLIHVTEICHIAEEFVFATSFLGVSCLKY